MLIHALAGGAIFTAGKASITGFELEGTVQALAGLTLSANYAYACGKYREFTLTNYGTNPQLDCTGTSVGTGGVVQLQCVPFQYTPRNQASLTALYRVPMVVYGGKVDSSITYAWTDRQYASSYTLPQTEPGAWLASYGLLNASLSWTTARNDKSTLNVRVFGTNLTSRDYRISNSNVWNVLYFRSSVYGEPRIFGIQLACG